MILSRIAVALVFCLALVIVGCSHTGQHTGQKASSSLIDPVVISETTDAGVERSIVQVTEDIYRFDSNDHSGLFMLTEHGIVLIDPLNLASAEWVKAEMDSKFGEPVTHVLYSHGHNDHASGAAVFDQATIISHKNTFDVIQPDASFKDVMPPTRTYSADSYALTTGGKSIEMHFVGGNHAADMSYIFFPEESIVFYVDIISLGALPFGELGWYSAADSQNTYDKALAIDADIAIPSHGPIGTQDDVRALQSYMADLRAGVSAGIDAGQSVEDIQSKLMLEDYAGWDYYEQRRPQNIAGMYRALMAE